MCLCVSVCWILHLFGNLGGAGAQRPGKCVLAAQQGGRWAFRPAETQGKEPKPHLSTARAASSAVWWRSVTSCCFPQRSWPRHLLLPFFASRYTYLKLCAVLAAAPPLPPPPCCAAVMRPLHDEHHRPPGGAGRLRAIEGTCRGPPCPRCTCGAVPRAPPPRSRPPLTPSPLLTRPPPRPPRLMPSPSPRRRPTRRPQAAPRGPWRRYQQQRDALPAMRGEGVAITCLPVARPSRGPAQHGRAR